MKAFTLLNPNAAAYECLMTRSKMISAALVLCAMVILLVWMGLHRARKAEVDFALPNGTSFKLMSVTPADGGIELKLQRYVLNGFLMEPGFRGASLMLVENSGNEVIGHQRNVQYNTSKAFGSPKVITEDFDWTFPVSADRLLHFRFFWTNNLQQTVFTNDFSIRNPVH